MRIDYKQYRFNASGLADVIVSKYADSLPETITEALCHFAENAIQNELEACAEKAREYAAHYPQGSDGRNTFVLLAEWIEKRARGA